VAIARAREVLNAGEPRMQRLHDWLVRLLAERSHLLCRVDVGTRYDIAVAWARRPGQMIIRTPSPPHAPPALPTGSRRTFCRMTDLGRAADCRTRDAGLTKPRAHST
jgi:hypothetical protein